MGRAGMKSASKGHECPVCGKDSHCTELTGTRDMRFGNTRDGAPIVAAISGVWICMKAAGLGLVQSGASSHQPCVNGYVPLGIWFGKPGQQQFRPANPGNNGGTYWYPMGQGPQADDGSGTQHANVRVLDDEARKAIEEQEAKQAAQKKESDRRSLAGSKEIWNGARGGENARALHDYLRARGIETSLLPGGRISPALRYAPVLKYKSDGDAQARKADPDDGKAGPGMLARVTNPDGSFGGLHRTYFALDGSPAKRKTGTQRKNSSNSLAEGAAVRLIDRPESDTLWVGEGIETMLAVGVAVGDGGVSGCGGEGVKRTPTHPLTHSRSHAPISNAMPSVYSALSASGLMNFVPPVDAVDGRDRVPLRVLVWAADLDRVQDHVGERPLERAYWHRPGVRAALKGAAKVAELHPEITQYIAMAQAEWLPEGVAEGGYDGLGELVPKADGTPRKSVDPDDALALLLERTGDGAEAARLLRAGLMVSLTPWKDLAERIERANAVGVVKKAETVSTGDEPSPSLRLVRSDDDALAGTRPEGGSGVADEDEQHELGDGDAKVKDIGDGTGDNGPRYRLLPKCRFARCRLVLDELYRPGGEWPREWGDHCFDPTWKKHTRARLADANSRWLVVYWVEGDQWYIYDGAAYRAVKQMEIEARVGDYLATFRSKTEKGKIKPAGLSLASVRDVLEAMKSEVMVRSEVIPAWAPETFDACGVPIWHTVKRGGRADGPAVVPTESGMIDIEELKAGRLKVYPLTPRFLSVHVLPHKLPLDELAAALAEDPASELRLCDLASKYAPEWMKQIGIQSEDDENWHRGLQQVFGMLLTNDMKFCTGTLLVGVSGTFKGTTLAALRTCHHKQNIAVASYDEVTRPFFAAGLLGKGILLIDELGAGRNSDKAATAQRIKGLIAGEPINVDLKHKEALGTYDHTLRLVMTSDRMPEFIDPAGAMRRRLAIFVCTKNYVGDPDVNIRERIKGEGMGILIWALGGLIDLYKMGRIVMPESGRDYLNRLVRDSSKPTAFLEDCLVVDRKSAVDAKLLYEMYRSWCNWNGMKCPQRAKVYEGFAAIVDRMKRTTLESYCKSQCPTTPMQTTDDLGRARTVITGIRPRLRKEGIVPGTTALVIERDLVWKAPAASDDRGPWQRDKDVVDAMDWDGEPQADESQDDIPY